MLLSTLLMLPLPPQDPAPGIDRELARQRAALLRDVEYDLRFRLQPDTREVEGTVTLRFRLPDDADPATPLVLDFAGSRLAEVTVNRRTATLRAVHDHVLIPPDLLVRDRNVLQATFASPVAPTGTPLSVYRDPADGREYYYTLVVPADAHRLYPCFDQPDLRARFCFELDLPSDWIAVANTTREVRPQPRFQIGEHLRTHGLIDRAPRHGVSGGGITNDKLVPGRPARVGAGLDRQCASLREQTLTTTNGVFVQCAHAQASEGRRRLIDGGACDE